MSDAERDPGKGSGSGKHGLWAWIKAKRIVLLCMAGAMFLGWASFGTWMSTIEYTNHTAFCIRCHVMKDTVYAEYTQSKHFKNEFGVVAGCPDCHVPQNSWIHEVGVKWKAGFELFDFIAGMNTVEKFTPIRPELAKKVWKHFADTNARECKRCHSYSNMVLEEQPGRAQRMHTEAVKTDANCVDCHKGITHKKFDVEEAATGAADGGFDVK
ncbi:MAG: NapC/NirT family cytochrome c [Nevskia sp.]|nr:NapC/NirT family cytochrome c [Nevskia sp.]